MPSPSPSSSEYRVDERLTRFVFGTSEANAEDSTDVPCLSLDAYQAPQFKWKYDVWNLLLEYPEPMPDGQRNIWTHHQGEEMDCEAIKDKLQIQSAIDRVLDELKDLKLTKLQRSKSAPVLTKPKPRPSLPPTSPLRSHAPLRSVLGSSGVRKSLRSPRTVKVKPGDGLVEKKREEPRIRKDHRPLNLKNISSLPAANDIFADLFPESADAMVLVHQPTFPVDGGAVSCTPSRECTPVPDEKVDSEKDGASGDEKFTPPRSFSIDLFSS